MGVSCVGASTGWPYSLGLGDRDMVGLWPQICAELKSQQLPGS